MPDPLYNAESEMDSVERFLSRLPGIEDYRQKEMRRDADKQVREMLARRLDTRRRKLTSMQNDLLVAGGLQWVDDLERVVGRIQLLTDRVKTAAYGYAPLFSLNRVRQDDLDRIMAFDRALFGELGGLDAAIGSLETAVANRAGIGEALGAVGHHLSDLNEAFARRAEVIQNIAE